MRYFLKHIETIFRSYFRHFHIAIGFGISLFAFVLLDSLSFSLINGNLLFVKNAGFVFDIFLLLITIIIITGIYAVFSSLLVFAVNDELFQGFKVINKSEYVLKSSSKIFTVFLLAKAIALLFYFFLPFFVMPLIYIIINISLFYVPQSIVIEEASIEKSLEYSSKHIKNNTKDFFLLIAIFLVLIFLLSLFFYYFNGVWSNILLTIINSIFLLPIFEISKTVIYLKKFELFASYLKH